MFKMQFPCDGLAELWFIHFTIKRPFCPKSVATNFDCNETHSGPIVLNKTQITDTSQHEIFALHLP